VTWWPPRTPGETRGPAGARRLIADLPELERQTIVLRFFQDLNQDAIAARLGYSQMHISRLQRRALARLRTQLVEA
jgi:RNA polymerase sigma-B factor